MGLKYKGKIQHDLDIINKKYGDEHYKIQLVQTLPSSDIKTDLLYKLTTTGELYSYVPVSGSENYEFKKILYEEEPTPPVPYEGYFGTVLGDISPVQIYSKAYTGVITMNSDSIVYKYPASLGDLTSIIGNGVNWLGLFTKTTEDIVFDPDTEEEETITYNVYTQSNTVSVTNFQISFA